MTLREYLRGKKYPGRFILCGSNSKGEVVLCYAIMGRSENSRNRIFVREDGKLKTKAYDESKVDDPSLIIYDAKLENEDYIVLANGDHSTTIMDALCDGKRLEDALIKRTYEPDSPNYTPRIAALFNKKDLSYSLSIIRKNETEEKADRIIYSYLPENGICHAIHTYSDDGAPLPSFNIDPPSFFIPDDITLLKNAIWESLDEENKVSLYVKVGDKEEIINKNECLINLKYGCNPNQKDSSISTPFPLPVKVLNGRPGYINLLDALNGYQLVRELREVTSLPAATSFKHVSPAGAAVYCPLSERERRMYFVKESEELSDLAVAYIRARGADRMSSFGDFIALSDVCDEATAKVISREVSDGIIAPGYEEKALEILKNKKKGAYCILSIDPEYLPDDKEIKTVYGISFRQKHNDYIPSEKDFANIVTEKKDLSAEAIRDLMVAQVALKYTQSNSVCYAKNGQTIGVGAGQQSRLHCTRLAGGKADLWNLRQSDKVLSLPFKDKLSRNDKDNIIEQYLSDEPEIDLFSSWSDYFKSCPEPFKEEEKKAYLKEVKGISLASDAFFPFPDNIERAARSGVTYIAEPGGSIRDDDVIKAANEHEMVMCFTGVRLFHH